MATQMPDPAVLPPGGSALGFQELKLFDNAAFGVFGYDRHAQIGYVNAWMRKTLGRPIEPGTPFISFFSDPASIAVLQTEIARRLEGHPGEYAVTIDTAKRPLEIQVYGTPIRDARGDVIGAVAFVTRAPLDKMRDALTRIGVRESAPLKALSDLSRTLESAYDFDALFVSMYDAGMTYARVLFAQFKDDPNEGHKWTKHWIPLDADQKTWILESSADDRAIDDIGEFLEQPRWSNLSNNPMTLFVQHKGLRSTAGVLVREGKNIVATVSLMSKRRGAYSPEIVQELHDLPIDRIVLSVINAIRANDTRFRFSLVRRLARQKRITDLTDRVVTFLQKQYRMARCSLFLISVTNDRARRLAEMVFDGNHRKSSELEIPLEGGHFAEIAKTGKPMYFKDIKSDEWFARYLKEDSGSAFCWPVLYDRGDGQEFARWVFCAIDGAVDAFSPVERESLTEIATDIGGLLQRLTEMHFMRVTFDTTSDAILVVDQHGEVRRANQAAADIFKLARPKAVTGHLSRFFSDPDLAAQLLRKQQATLEAEVRADDGEHFKALVNSRPLPDDIGGKVIAIEDLRKIWRQEELSFLGRIASELTLQVQTPITLTSNWAERITTLTKSVKNSGTARAQSEPLEQINELACRSIMQLGRVQSVLDRLALYDPDIKFEALPAIPVNLEAELTKTIVSLPKTERTRVRLHPHHDGVAVYAHPGHIDFVVDTLLSVFLRGLPDNGSLTFTTGKDDDKTGWFACQAHKHASRKPGTSAAEGPVPVSDELLLVEHGLQQIVAGYGGKFEATRSSIDGRLSRVRVNLPLCQ